MIRKAFCLLSGAVTSACLWTLPVSAEEDGTPRGVRIGLVASSPAVAGLTEIEQAYSRALGVPVTVFVARDFPTLVEAHVHSDIDYAVYSATAFAVAWKLCGCVEPIAAPTGADGTYGVKAILIRRKGANGDDNPRSIEAENDVAHGGASAPALVDPGYRALADTWRQLPRMTPTEAEAGFAAGERVALYGWALDRPVGGMDLQQGTFGRLVSAGTSASDLEVVWSSETLRFGPHAVRQDLPEGLKARIRDFLTNMKLAYPDLYDFVETERQGGFVRVSHADYLPAIAMVDRILDPEGATAR